jgi:hypothetical protein
VARRLTSEDVLQRLTDTSFFSRQDAGDEFAVGEDAVVLTRLPEPAQLLG